MKPTLRPPAGSGGRPNIVFILTDDLDELTMPYRAAMPKTMEYMRRHGIRFTRTFATTPLCCPSRASILTGKYAHNTGVLGNGGSHGGWETFFNNGEEQNTVGVWLKDNGYRTALIGKYLNGYSGTTESSVKRNGQLDALLAAGYDYEFNIGNSGETPAAEESSPGVTTKILTRPELPYVPPGWTDWKAGVDPILNFYNGYNYSMSENGRKVSYGSSTGDYLTDKLTEKAVDFIRSKGDQRKDRPFFLFLAPTAPHTPLQPAARNADNPFNSRNAPRRPNFNEKDVSDKPLWLRLTKGLRYWLIEASVDIEYRRRMGTLYAVDDMVREVIKTLRKERKLKNTYIIFTSDNGFTLGSHRTWGKIVPYEESLRVPLYISGPGIRPGIEKRMALNIDFAPTIAEMAGIDPPESVDGQSLMPLMTKRDPINQLSGWRHDFIAQYHFEGDDWDLSQYTPKQQLALLWAVLTIWPPSYRSLHTERYQYIEWYNDLKPDGVHEYELYDLRKDPFQLQNLLATKAGKRRYRRLTDRLARRLDVLGSCSGPTCRTP